MTTYRNREFGTALADSGFVCAVLSPIISLFSHERTSTSRKPYDLPETAIYKGETSRPEWPSLMYCIVPPNMIKEETSPISFKIAEISPFGQAGKRL
jgi:hypothetical protein